MNKQSLIKFISFPIYLFIYLGLSELLSTTLNIHFQGSITIVGISLLIIFVFVNRFKDRLTKVFRSFSDFLKSNGRLAFYIAALLIFKFIVILVSYKIYTSNPN